MTYQQEIVSDRKAFEMLQHLMVEGVKLKITPCQDILSYRGQTYTFTVLQAKNRVLVEYYAK